jgi:hypothetical protein
MSSTRKAKDDSVFHQSRYASSGEYEPGLIASLVARRCCVLQAKADRNLIWSLHYLSHQPGGLKSVAETLVSKSAGLFGTRQMVKIGKRAGQNYTAEAVREIRRDLPCQLRGRFLLKGEDVDLLTHSICEAKKLVKYEELWGGEAERRIEESESRPLGYPVDNLINFCREAALSGISHNCTEKTDRLEVHLRNLCLDPAVNLRSESAAPWYFSDLIPALERYMAEWIAQRAAGVVVTALGKDVHEMLDYTLHSGAMTLLEGDARTGKSFAARSWCEQHPGQARFIEVPTGNDDTGFFLALARGLGMGNFSQYKARELRERVESVLLTRDILICLDEAHRLWPEMNFRYGFPKRVNWLMSMANHKVPFCLVATPQFIERQKASEQNAGWNSAQFIGRLADYRRLPGELGIEDLMAVASSVLPEADTRTIRALAAYARTSARCLAAIDSIAARARYVANRAGNEHATTEHVRKAMQESVIPSDTMLVRTLERGRKAMHKGRSIPPLPAQSEIEPLSRGTRQVPNATDAPDFRRCAGNVAELIHS